MMGKSLWSECPRERVGTFVEAGRLRGGNAYTMLSSKRGEVGHAVNEKARS